MPGFRVVFGFWHTVAALGAVAYLPEGDACAVKMEGYLAAYAGF